METKKYNKRLKYIMATILVLALVSINNFADANNDAGSIEVKEDKGITTVQAFSDVPTNHWAYSYINNLKEINAIGGYSDGSFKPDNRVRRDEAVKMVLSTFGYSESEEGAYWCQNYLDRGVAEGILLDSRWEKMFNEPREYMVREEAFRLIQRTLIKKEEKHPTVLEAGIELGTKDFDEIGNFCLNGYYFCRAKGIVEGYEDGTIRPLDFITRAELSKMINVSMDDSLRSEYTPPNLPCYVYDTDKYYERDIKYYVPESKKEFVDFLYYVESKIDDTKSYVFKDGNNFNTAFAYYLDSDTFRSTDIISGAVNMYFTINIDLNKNQTSNDEAPYEIESYRNFETFDREMIKPAFEFLFEGEADYVLDKFIEKYDNPIYTSGAEEITFNSNGRHVVIENNREFVALYTTFREAQYLGEDESDL